MYSYFLTIHIISILCTLNNLISIFPNVELPAVCNIALYPLHLTISNIHKAVNGFPRLHAPYSKSI